MRGLLLFLVLLVVWGCFVVWAVGTALSAWGMVPAIIVGVLLLAPRARQ